MFFSRFKRKAILPMKTAFGKRLTKSLLILPILFIYISGSSQTITGAWRGKIHGSKVELKIIKTGDSLVGTSYYYSSKNNYRRYSIRGYFDGNTNDVIWWDDVLIEENGSRNILSSAAPALLSVADFNCPGYDEMLLDGNSNLKDNMNSSKKELHLEKVSSTQFPDEWDYVIENYTVGANDPYFIDSIASLNGNIPVMQDEEIIASTPKIKPIETSSGPMVKTEVPVSDKTLAPVSTGNLEKFNNRKKVLQTVIPITAKTIELRFYDNAQVDGDSIALFLNNRMIFEHIRLTDQAYVIKLRAEDLDNDNELVMVAENLGSIPPNTSFMVAIVGDKRYEARLFANENSSALIRFIKQ